MADTDPIGPFAATVAGVIGLLPQATFPDVLAVGQKGVTKPMIAGYIGDLSGQVLLRIAGYDRLDQTFKDAAIAAAKEAVHTAAASYAQAARFPEQANKADDGYAEVLWDRYKAALDTLAAQVTAWLSDLDKATPEPSEGALWSFPDAQITETTGF